MCGYNWYGVIEYLGQRLSDDHLLSVPACPLQKQALGKQGKKVTAVRWESVHSCYLHIGTIFWFAVHISLLLQHLKLEAKVVNGNGVLPCIVLQHTCRIASKQVHVCFPT